MRKYSYDKKNFSYNAGGASYERSIYLELFNGDSTFKRDLKKEKSRIANPRLNLCLLGHPQFFVKSMREEQATRDDGLMQRFLFSCPKPQFYDPDDIMKAQLVPRKCSFTVLMYVIKVFHEQSIKETKNNLVIKKCLNTDGKKKDIKYTFNAEAQELYYKIFREFKNIREEMNEYDTFIR